MRAGQAREECIAKAGQYLAILTRIRMPSERKKRPVFPIPWKMDTRKWLS